MASLLSLGSTVYSCINDPDDGTECNLSKPVDDTKLGGAAGAPWVCHHTEDLDRLEKFSDKNVMKFKLWECRGRNNATCQCILGANRLERLGSPGGQQDEHKTAMCPCRKENLEHPELH